MSDSSIASGTPPNWRQLVRSRLAPLRLDAARETEIVEELSQHLDERFDALRRNGASDADARRIAIEELLEPEALANHLRPLRQASVPPPVTLGDPKRSLLADFWRDLRYAARMLRRQPGFTVAAVLTLALGIGANSAMFALVDATLLRPLPYPNPDRLVMLWERSDANPRGNVAPSNLVDWTTRTGAFEATGGFVPNVGGMVMAGADGHAETVARQWVTAGYFEALGVKPIAGRTFSAEDDAARAELIVISEAFWRTRFNADPSVIGQPIRLDGDMWTLVGVVPNEAQVLPTSIWGMVPITNAPPAARAQRMFRAVGRLKADVTSDVANAELAAVATQLAQEFPKTNAGRGVTIEPMADVVIGGDLRRTSMLLLGVLAFVLLICCANVANLLMARATVRTRELAIRTAVGADRRRVVRQLLTESVLLALVGGALGLLVGAAILEAAPAVMPPGLLPSTVTLAFDVRVVAFCAATALVVGLLFGLAPAWQVTELVSPQALASGSRTTTGRGGRLRHLLVGAEVATAVLLLFGAGLLLRTLLAVEGVDRGYRAESILTMLVDPHGGRYPDDAAELRFYDAVEQGVRALPGVRGVAWATTLPYGESYEGTSLFAIVGDPPLEESERPTADYQIVSPAFFDTLDLPVVSGRGFDDRDRPGSVPVCIVNEAFVRTQLRGRSPIGVRVSIHSSASAQSPAVVREIVGVARQIKGRPDETRDLLQIYVPLAQDTPGDIFMLVRPVSGPAESLASGARAAISRIDTDQLVSVRNVITLGDVAWEATARHRFRAVMVMAFAGLALVLAMVGLFGILAYSVQQRIREFGVRRALGASSRDVLRDVAGQAARVILSGAAVGLALSVVLGRLLTTMLYEVQPLDPTTFAAVAVVLTLTALAAVIGPAWRATRIEPAITLRGE